MILSVGEIEGISQGVMSEVGIVKLSKSKIAYMREFQKVGWVCSKRDLVILQAEKCSNGNMSNEKILK